MGHYIIKMPDIGEGIAEVELVQWHVKPGDVVAEEQVLADVMTDKANVEIPSHVAAAAAEETGIDAEIIDLRTLLPLDMETIEASVAKTGRCVIAHEATRTSGFGAELSAAVQERCFYALEAPIERVTGWDTPYPHAQEWAYFPGPKRIGEALKRVMEAS